MVTQQANEFNDFSVDKKYYSSKEYYLAASKVHLTLHFISCFAVVHALRETIALSELRYEKTYRVFFT